MLPAASLATCKDLVGDIFLLSAAGNGGCT